MPTLYIQMFSKNTTKIEMWKSSLVYKYWQYFDSKLAIGYLCVVHSHCALIYFLSFVQFSLSQADRRKSVAHLASALDEYSDCWGLLSFSLDKTKTEIPNVATAIATATDAWPGQLLNPILISFAARGLRNCVADSCCQYNAVFSAHNLWIAPVRGQRQRHNYESSA